MIPTIENILKALFAGDMDVATASRYIATHIALAEHRGAALIPSPTPTAPQEADALPPFSELARLTQWLDAKFAQHGDQEDADASKLLHKLWRAALAPREADALREALKDTERLDWLERQSKSYGFADVHEGNVWEIGGAYKSVRDAIDHESAALAQHQPQQGEQ